MAELLHKVLNLSVHHYVHHGAQNYFFFQKFLQNHKIYYLRTLQLNLQSPRTIMIFYSILSSVLIRNGVGGALESSEGQYMITVTKKKKKNGKEIQYDLEKIQYDLVYFLIW